jgi:hypothetical protein
VCHGCCWGPQRKSHRPGFSAGCPLQHAAAEGWHCKEQANPRKELGPTSYRFGLINTQPIRGSTPRVPVPVDLPGMDMLIAVVCVRPPASRGFYII